MTSFTRTETARIPGGISDGMPEPAFSPASLFGRKNSPLAMGKDRTAANDGRLQMEAVGGQIGGRKANRFHVAVFHLGANRNVVGCHHHLYARRSIATAPRLQSAVDSETDHCAQDEGHKANHQKPGAIHELLLKVEIATTARDSMTRNGDATTHAELRLPIGEVTNRFAGADPTPE